MMMSITIQQIADETNLSIATISRILNGKGAHNPDTIRRVRAVRLQLSGKSVGTHALSSIGVVMLSHKDFLQHPYSNAALDGIIEALHEADFTCHIIPVGMRRFTIADFECLIEHYDLKGLLFQELDRVREIMPKLKELPIPVVRIGELSDPCSWNCVYTSGFQVGADAANYLWSMGYRRFGLVYVEAEFGQDRRRDGFIAQLTELGSPETACRTWASYIEYPAVQNLAMEINTMTEPPEVIFAANSTLASHLCRTLHKLGWRIPEQISIIAIEDDNELEYDGITALTQPVKIMGRLAVDLLLNLIGNRESGPHEVVLSCRLNVRETTLSRRER